MTPALRRLQPYLFLLPVTLVLVTLLVFPLAYTVRASMSSFDSYTFTIGSFVGLEHFADVLQDGSFWRSLRVTVEYLVWALLLQMVLGTAVSFLLAVEWPGVQIVRASLLIPLVVAPVVAGSVWKTLLDPLWGYVNHMLGWFGIPALNWLSDPSLAMASIIVIDTWRWTPFVILIVLAGIVSMDVEIQEAARIDGAGAWQSFVHVRLPLLAPVLLAAFVVRWLGAIKMFDIIFTATRGGPGSVTEVVNLYIYETAFRNLAIDEASAMAVLIVLVSLVVTYVLVAVTNRVERSVT